MNQTRPVNLDLTSLQYPPMAIASILHRISGIVLFLLMPVMIYFLQLSLLNAGSFVNLQHTLASPLHKLMIWAFGAALIYHLLAGIRHILMDLGYGEHLHAARNSAIGVIVLSIILMLSLGIWLW